MTNQLLKKIKGVIKLKVNKSSKKGFSNVVLTAISQGLLWAIMAIGVFITFRILDLADLTAEGLPTWCCYDNYHDYPWNQPSLRL